MEILRQRDPRAVLRHRAEHARLRDEDVRGRGIRSDRALRLLVRPVGDALVRPIGGRGGIPDGGEARNCEAGSREHPVRPPVRHQRIQTFQRHFKDIRLQEEMEPRKVRRTLRLRAPRRHPHLADDPRSRLRDAPARDGAVRSADIRRGLPDVRGEGRPVHVPRQEGGGSRRSEAAPSVQPGNRQVRRGPRRSREPAGHGMLQVRNVPSGPSLPLPLPGAHSLLRPRLLRRKAPHGTRRDGSGHPSDRGPRHRRDMGGQMQQDGGRGGREDAKRDPERPQERRDRRGDNVQLRPEGPGQRHAGRRVRIGSGLRQDGRGGDAQNGERRGRRALHKEHRERPRGREGHHPVLRGLREEPRRKVHAEVRMAQLPRRREPPERGHHPRKGKDGHRQVVRSRGHTLRRDLRRAGGVQEVHDVRGRRQLWRPCQGGGRPLVLRCQREASRTQGDCGQDRRRQAESHGIGCLQRGWDRRMRSRPRRQMQEREAARHRARLVRVRHRRGLQVQGLSQTQVPQSQRVGHSTLMDADGMEESVH